MSDIKDIWTDDAGHGLNDEQLLAYLEGRLSAEEQHRVEAKLASEGMDSDALEGLQALGADATKALTHSLNLELNRSLKRKRRRRRQAPFTQRWTGIAILIILVLAVLAFVVIRMRTR